MDDSSWQEEVGRRAVAIQIMTGTLLAGPTVFLTVAAVLVSRDVAGPDKETASVMNLALILLLVANGLAWMIVPSVVVSTARRKIAAGKWILPEGVGQAQAAASAEFIERTGDAGRWLCVHQTKTIIACALLEGVAFFAIIVYLVTQSMIGLGIAVALIVGLALHIPSRSGVVRWIEGQLLLIEQNRQFDSN